MPPNTQFGGIFSVYTALSHFHKLSPWGVDGRTPPLVACGQHAQKRRDRTTQASIDSIGLHVKTNHTPGDTCNSVGHV